MKAVKKHKKDLSRLGAYLEKETGRLAKALAHDVDGETSALATEIIRRLKERQREAVAHLEAVHAALTLMKLDKKDAGKKADTDKTAKKTKAMKGDQLTAAARAPRRAGPKKAAETVRAK